MYKNKYAYIIFPCIIVTIQFKKNVGNSYSNNIALQLTEGVYSFVLQSYTLKV